MQVLICMFSLPIDTVLLWSAEESGDCIEFAVVNYVNISTPLLGFEPIKNLHFKTILSNLLCDQFITTGSSFDVQLFILPFLPAEAAFLLACITFRCVRAVQ